MQHAARLLAFLAVVIHFGIDAARAVEWTAQSSAQADAIVSHYLRPRRLSGVQPPPSLAVAVGINGRLVLARGYGEARPGVPATETTVYQIGSLTKQFTAAAMLRLIEERAIAPLTGAAITLETHMSAIFEGVESWTAADEPPITVRSLLNMTSNLPNFTRRPPPDIDPWGAVPAPRLLAALKKLAPRGWPHSFEYSNTSYFLISQIIGATRAAQQRHTVGYRDYIRAAIIDKAGMTRTGFVGDAAADADIAQPHYRRRPVFAQPDWLAGSGDMASNVVDLFAWNRALMVGSIVAPDSLAAMFGDGGRVGPVTYYGMGWFVQHGTRWDTYSHSGSVPGFTAYNAIFRRNDSPSWVSVTLLSNADGVEDLDRLADELVDLVRAE